MATRPAERAGSEASHRHTVSCPRRVRDASLHAARAGESPGRGERAELTGGARLAAWRTQSCAKLRLCSATLRRCWPWRRSFSQLHIAQHPHLHSRSRYKSPAPLLVPPAPSQPNIAISGPVAVERVSVRVPASPPTAHAQSRNSMTSCCICSLPTQTLPDCALIPTEPRTRTESSSLLARTRIRTRTILEAFAWALARWLPISVSLYRCICSMLYARLEGQLCNLCAWAA